MHPANTTVFKYPLTVTDVATVRLPRNAEILCVQAQHDQPCLWAAVNPNEVATEDRKIRLAGTGHNLGDPENLRYLGTFQVLDGTFVGHVFEIL